MRIHYFKAAVAAAATFFSGAALAHPGYAHGVLAGVLHPLLGLDHLLAMLAVGIWAARLGGRARWLMPASFLVCMALAAGIGMAGIAMPLAEGGIAASVLLAGLLIASPVIMAPALGGLLVALFALAHGYAHGMEMPALASPWLYGAGFILATATLHAAGLFVGGRLQQQKWGWTAAGSAIAACGGWMLSAVA
ncbi:HupE/UreJ family protein [Noviherbaspirillum sedimenti]|uniref:Urease accessory protein UreJ n=1 Tax=Noviherbaspirillum sedimenti TaxID=2320865 RepID=A0A3A3G617_9BURK|nr:HupE/UreJ family protein [Noviherbaspirillum sedimenti]RJG01962.1 urease accessory protein UreJ [Noviherbaspirillum sedimenti]